MDRMGQMAKFRSMVPAGSFSWNLPSRVDRIRLPKDQGRHGRLKVEKDRTLIRYNFPNRGFGGPLNKSRYVPAWWWPDRNGETVYLWPAPMADVELEFVRYFWLRPFFVIAHKLGLIAR